MKIIKIIAFDDSAEETLKKLKELGDNEEIEFNDAYISDENY